MSTAQAARYRHFYQRRSSEIAWRFSRNGLTGMSCGEYRYQGLERRQEYYSSPSKGLICKTIMLVNDSLHAGQAWEISCRIPPAAEKNLSSRREKETRGTPDGVPFYFQRRRALSPLLLCCPAHRWPRLFYEAGSQMVAHFLTLG